MPPKPPVVPVLAPLAVRPCTATGSRTAAVAAVAALAEEAVPAAAATPAAAAASTTTSRGSPAERVRPPLAAGVVRTSDAPPPPPPEAGREAAVVFTVGAAREIGRFKLTSTYNVAPTRGCDRRRDLGAATTRAAWKPGAACTRANGNDSDAPHIRRHNERALADGRIRTGHGVRRSRQHTVDAA